MASIAGILLAAGAARRFGGAKLLHLLPDGRPIGVAAWEHLRCALDRTVVVVRPGDDAVARCYRDAGAQVVVSPDAERGMGHSLASGVAATPDAPGWIIALADMPNVRSQTIAAVAAAIGRGARIALPVYRSERGHPVGFSAVCRDELLALSGDSGARALLQRHAEEVAKVEVDDPGVLQDVDTREDAARILALQAPGSGRQTPGA
jgi:molybdenum cofactor cytidylyltransferase